MKKAAFLIVLALFFSCKSETKKEKIEYPQIENLSTDMKSLFKNVFSFTENIIIDEIGLIHSGENTYKLVYFLVEESDFETIEKLNIAFRVYPKEVSLFENQSDRDEGAKTLATKSKIKEMNNSLVIVSDEFKIIPKEFEKVNVYFYDPKDGIVGKTMTILDVNF